MNKINEKTRIEISGIDKIDFHAATGKLAYRKGKVSAKTNGRVIRLRINGEWMSAYDKIVEIIDGGETKIKREDVSTVNFICGISSDIVETKAALYVARIVFGVKMTTEQETEGLKVYNAYIRAVKKAQKAKIKEWFAIVENGKIEYLDGAKKKAEKTFDAIEKRVEKLKKDGYKC